MAKKEKKVLDKQGWIQSFSLVGKPAINEYTFILDAQSKSSDWIYNTMNLDVDCGEKYGKIRCEMNGGYGAGRDNKCYVHGKKEDGSDDFENFYQIDWEDREDIDILKDVGDLCFTKIGIEKDTNDEVVVYRFLSPYDAIRYLSETLTKDMMIRVNGRLEYTCYQDNIQIKKRINSIYLAKEKDEPIAKFTQTMLIDKYSVGKKDNDKNIVPVSSYILEKFKEYRGIDLTDDLNRGGKLVPLKLNFEYELDPEDVERTNKKIELLFKVKKGYTMVTYEGVFVEGGALITTTYDDLDDDIKDFVDTGVFSLEEALDRCTENKGKVKRMIIKKPIIKMIGEEGSKVAQLQKFENKYSDEDLVLDYLIKNDTEDEEDEEELPFVENEEDINDDSWLDKLG